MLPIYLQGVLQVRGGAGGGEGGVGRGVGGMWWEGGGGAKRSTALAQIAALLVEALLGAMNAPALLGSTRA